MGYGSKFQTAGNLIFKPEEKSTLHLTGTNTIIVEKERFNKDHDVNDRQVREHQRDR